MKRREALKRTALLMGYAVSASAMAGVMSGCQADTKTPMDEWKPTTFDATQINTIREAAERIIPATEGIVGAKDVMVERFVDQLMTGFYKLEKITAYKQGLDKLNTNAQAKYNKAFADLKADEMDAMITDLANATKTAKAGEEPFFFALKETALLGYFTNEKVGTEVLNYDPVPGGFKSCLPLTEVPNGRSWTI